MITQKNFIICILAVLYSFMIIIGYSINIDFSLDFIFNNIGVATISFVLLLIIFFLVIKLCFNLLDKEKEKKALSKTNKNRVLVRIKQLYLKYNSIDREYNGKIGFYIKATIMSFIYFLFFLQYSPGVITFDTSYQIEQFLGLLPLKNHHPILHTFLIGFSLNIGKTCFNNYNVGLFIYCLLQILAMSMIFSYLLTYLKKNNVSFFIRVFSFLFLSLFPINIIFSFTIWKDIPFALSMLMFIINLHKICKRDSIFFDKKKNFVLLFINVLLVMLFRNNGLHVVVLSLIGVFFIKKYRKECFLTIIASVVLYNLYLNVLLPAVNIQLTSPRELFSIPSQQFAKLAKERGRELSKEEKEKINLYFDYETIAKEYNPILSDPVKATFKLEGYEADKFGLFKLYFELFLKYPKETFEAFFSNNYGYWYPFSKSNDGVSFSFFVADDLKDLELKRTSIMK